MLYSSDNCSEYNADALQENSSTYILNMSLFVKQTPEVPKYIQITSTVFFTCIFLLGVFGNLLVILVVCMNRNMKTSVNIYLINLCIADILVLTVCMPPVLVDVYARDVWYFGETMCSVVPFLENTVAASSVLTLIAISTERYRVVCDPLTGIRDDILKSLKVVPFIWLFCMFCNIPWFYIAKFRDSSHLDGTPIKVCRQNMNFEWQKTYAAFLCIMFFVIPFSILLILYLRICYLLHYTHDEMPDGGKISESCHGRNRRNLKLQVINTVISLVLLFFIFHLPYRVISMWFIFAKSEDIHSLGIEKYFNILYSARTMFYLNHSINPILYNFVSTKFRNALRCTLMRLRSGRGRDSSYRSNRRGNSNTQFTRPNHNHPLTTDEACGKEDPENSNLKSQLNKERINEFFPMYATIIQKHDGAKLPECCLETKVKTVYEQI